MKKLYLVLSLLSVLALSMPFTSSAQIVMGDTPGEANASAVLELKSTSKGFLPPRLTTDQRNAIAEPANGMVVFNTTLNCLELYSAGSWTCLDNQASAGTYPPRLSYNQIQALPSPQPGDMVYDLDFACLRIFNGSQWVSSYETLGEKALDGIAWQAGGEGRDQGHDVAVDQAGNVYVTGIIEGSVTFGNQALTSKGAYDILLAKYTSTGQVLWAKNLGGTGIDAGRGVAVDQNGNIYLVGTFADQVNFGDVSYTSLNGSRDIFIAKYTSEGVLLWAKQAGGTGDDTGARIVIDNKGNLYVAGTFRGAATFGEISLVSNGNDDGFIAKLNSEGTFQWVQKAGGPSYDGAADVTVDEAGNAYLIGDFFSTATIGSTSLVSRGEADGFIAKYTSSGTVEWAHGIGGTKSDYGRSVAVDRDGNVYVVGVFQGSVTLGNTTLTSSGGNDVFIVKLSSSGSYVWAQKAGGDADDDISCIKANASGEVYMTGSFRNTLAVGPKALVASKVGQQDIYLAKLAANGSLLWAQRDGGIGMDLVLGLAVDTSNNVYITGIYQYITTIRNRQLPNAGSYDLFIARYKE